MLISAVQQGDSVAYIYAYICIYTHIYTHIYIVYVCVCVCVYIYIHTFFFSYSFPLWFIIGHWIYFPVVYRKTLLFHVALQYPYPIPSCFHSCLNPGNHSSALHPTVLSFQGCYANGIVQYVTFEGWLFTCHLILWRSIQMVACIKSLLLFIVEWGPTVWMYHLSVEGFLGCFQFGYCK